MSREVSFTIFEKPLILKRHRHTKSGHTYDPQKKDKLYYGILIKKAIEGYCSLKEHLLCGPLSIDMKFYFPLPKAKALRKKKGLYNTDKKDLDNAIKGICDVCSGILYVDDAYVYNINAYKFNTTGAPRTEVTIKEIMQEPIVQTNQEKACEKNNQKTQMSRQAHECEKNIWPARSRPKEK